MMMYEMLKFEFKFGNKHDVYEVLVLTIHCNNTKLQKVICFGCRSCSQISVQVIVGIYEKCFISTHHPKSYLS